jgi:hypothetical protein
MVYQDIWVNGKMALGGNRDQPSGVTNCADRYKVLKNFFYRYKYKNIKILDFGANCSYFANRLAEDFPEFEIITVEGRPECEIPLKMSEAIYPGVTALTKHMYSEELEELLKVGDFDVVLCLNVLHHVDEHIPILKLFEKYVDTIIVETYGIDPLPGIHNDRVISLHNYFKDINTIQINDWLDYEQWRPMFYYNDREIEIEGTPSSGFGTAGFSTILWNKDTLRGQLLVDDIYLGTLNIDIKEEVKLRDPAFKIVTNFKSEFHVWPAFLFGYPVHIFHPKTEDGVKRIDLISTHKLRDRFGLANGDKVVLSIDKKYLEL